MKSFVTSVFAPTPLVTWLLSSLLGSSVNQNVVNTVPDEQFAFSSSFTTTLKAVR